MLDFRKRLHLLINQSATCIGCDCCVMLTSRADQEKKQLRGFEGTTPNEHMAMDGRAFTETK